MQSKRGATTASNNAVKLKIQEPPHKRKRLLRRRMTDFVFFQPGDVEYFCVTRVRAVK